MFMSATAVIGCGDGIGRPIVEHETSQSAAGVGGVAGVAGVAGVIGGAGAAGVTGIAGAGVSGAPGGFGGTGGFGGLPTFGGRGWQGPEGEGRGDRPPEPRCDGIDTWPEDSSSREFAVFGFLNYLRESGFACAGDAAAMVPHVSMKPQIQCAARLHARDMYENDYLDDINNEGEGPEDRIRRAGYVNFRIASETNVRSRELEELVPYRELDELFRTGGRECRNLVDPNFDSVGIGFFGDRWTLDFAGP